MPVFAIPPPLGVGRQIVCRGETDLEAQQGRNPPSSYHTRGQIKYLEIFMTTIVPRQQSY